MFFHLYNHRVIVQITTVSMKGSNRATKPSRTFSPSLIANMLDVVDNLIIGGGMAYTFIKNNGGAIGDSIFEKDKLNDCSKIMSLAGGVVTFKNGKIDKFLNNIDISNIVLETRLDRNLQGKSYEWLDYLSNQIGGRLS